MHQKLNTSLQPSYTIVGVLGLQTSLCNGRTFLNNSLITIPLRCQLCLHLENMFLQNLLGHEFHPRTLWNSGFLTHQNTLADITEAIVRLTLPLIHNIHNIQGQLIEFGPIAFWSGKSRWVWNISCRTYKNTSTQVETDVQGLLLKGHLSKPDSSLGPGSQHYLGPSLVTQ